MNIKIALLLLFLFFAKYSEAQQYSVNYSLRFESFSMNEIRQLQESVTSQWPVEAHHIVDMPSRLTHAGSVTFYNGEQYSYGLLVGYGSTGSRYYYEDYSGYLSNDFITNRFDISAQFSLYESLKSSKLIFRIEPGINLSTLKIKSKSFIANQISEDEINFESRSLSFRPGIGWRKIVNKFFMEGMVMYEVNLPSKLLFSTNKNYYLRGADGNEADTNWSGLKLNFTVGLFIF